MEEGQGASGGDRVDALLLHDRSGVAQAGGDVLRGQVWELGEDSLVRPALGEQIDHELDGDARAANDRLADEDLGINEDTFVKILIGHGCAP